MHFLKTDEPIDNELLVETVRSFIPVLLAWPQARRDDFAPTTPGYKGRRIQIRDLMAVGAGGECWPPDP